MSSENPSTTDYLADCLQVCLGYGNLLVADIPAGQFTTMPHPKMNHPAFILGHVTLTANGALEMLGRPEKAVTPDGYPALFEMGAECKAEAGLYPSKDDLVGLYVQQHEAALEALRQAPDDLFQRENPASGRFKEMFPTVGGALNFLVNCHHMSHLGQISFWRRAVGLDSVLKS